MIIDDKEFAFLCDHKKCENCHYDSPYGIQCNYTTEFDHALNKNIYSKNSVTNADAFLESNKFVFVGKVNGIKKYMEI